MNLAEIEEKTNYLFHDCNQSIDSICSILGNLGSDEQISQMKFLFYDVEELFCQIRYNLFEALKIYYTQDNTVPEINDSYLAISSALLLRSFIREKSKVNFANPNEFRRGKKVSNWLLHMFIDNAIFRVVSVFDRIAKIVALSGNIKFTNDKVYFRSNKLETIFSNLSQK
jgi:hypothetical protein